MTRSRWTRALGLSLIAMLTTGTALAGEQTITLTERINVDWKRELVTCPVQFEPGACYVDSVRLRGPAGPVACQLVETELFAGGKFVKTAKVAFIADLKPLAVNAYTLSFGPRAVGTSQPKTDLTVKSDREGVEITTRHIGARLRLGKHRFSRPANPSKVPGPVAALRTADGKWFGGSKLYGKNKVTGYTATLVDEGPVLAAVEYQYEYANGDRFTLRVSVTAGDNAVLYDCDVKTKLLDGNRNDVYRKNGLLVNLSEGLPPLVFRTWVGSSTKRPEFRKMLKADQAERKRIAKEIQRLKRQGKRTTLKVERKRLWTELPLKDYPSGTITNLTPWANWWSDMILANIRLLRTDRLAELRLVRRRGGDWVEPAPAGQRPKVSLTQKLLPVVKGTDGSVVVELNAAPGKRHWSLVDYTPQIQSKKTLSAEEQTFGWRDALERHSLVGRYLDEVKDYVLEWKSKPGRTHPHWFMTRDDLAKVWERGKPGKKLINELTSGGPPVQPYPHSSDARALAAFLVTGDKRLARKVKLPERLRTRLGFLGQFDMMRATLYVAALYDGLIDSDLVTEKERKLYRAQLAFLAYKQGHPNTWSTRRGYGSGNPNMHVSHNLSLGMLACLIPDHPMAREWAADANAMMDEWMKQVGPKGEWHESFHYTDVSVRVMVVYAITARNAGFRDFFKEGILKKLGTYTATFYTPRDPQRGNVRCGPPLGRSNAGATYGLQGALGRATAESDPDYSKRMQWLWQRTGYSQNKQTHRFGGWEYVYFDRTLPTAKPDWETDLFGRVGVLLRHSLDSPHEHYLAMFTNFKTHFARGTEKGAIVKLFMKGQPIGGSPCGGYWHRHDLLMNRVCLARAPVTDAKQLHPYGHQGPSKVTGFAATPRADYIGVHFDITRPWDTWKWTPPIPKPLLEWVGAKRAGKPPYQWDRQVLFIKDDDPAATNYLLLRDTVSGKQPTFWHFWTLSEKIGTPSEVRNRKAFLRDKPGDKCVPASPLKGDRFTAVGQFKADLEYYVASPADTPRYTLRYSDIYTYPIGGFVESQDCLHLQLPGDGAYYVALFPRLRNEPVPDFKTLAAGKVIQVNGPWGTDYGLLSETPTDAQAEGAIFTGTTAAAVQDRKKGLALCLAAKGEVQFKQFGIASDVPATLRVKGRRLTVEVHRYHNGTTVTLTSPAPPKLAATAPQGVVLIGNRLSIPKGVTKIELTH